jgi:hypothetical protein
MNFLINNEVIRDSFDKYNITIKTDATETLFIAFLRLHLFTMIATYNKSDVEQELLDKSNIINDRYEVILNSLNILPKVPTPDKIKKQLIHATCEYLIDDM